MEVKARTVVVLSQEKIHPKLTAPLHMQRDTLLKI
jgi:hypothetical protein